MKAPLMPSEGRAPVGAGAVSAGPAGGLPGLGAGVERGSEWEQEL